MRGKEREREIKREGDGNIKRQIHSSTLQLCPVSGSVSSLEWNKCNEMLTNDNRLANKQQKPQGWLTYKHTHCHTLMVHTYRISLMRFIGSSPTWPARVEGGRGQGGAAKWPPRPDNYGLVPFVFPSASTSHADRHDANDDCGCGCCMWHYMTLISLALLPLLIT